jgi:hypothetical protein
VYDAPVRAHTLLVCILVAACGSKPPPVAPAVKAVRTLQLELESDRGHATFAIDGVDRAHAAGGATNLVFDLREGPHKLSVRGEAEQYGGMGLKMTLKVDGEELVQLGCAVPCDAAKLDAWATGLRASLARPCAGANLRVIDTKSDESGSFNAAITVDFGVEKGKCH